VIVQFRHKMRKLVDGRSLASARKHTLRLLRTNRFSLETKRVIETIDPVRFRQIRERYAVADPGADWPKYLDLERWIGINIRRIHARSAFSIWVAALDIFSTSRNCSAIPG